MADNLSKWVGGSNFIKIKKWGNGTNNSVTPTQRKTRYRCGTSVGTLGQMKRELHLAAVARHVPMNKAGVPYV